jgi:hypothetical protein
LGKKISFWPHRAKTVWRVNRHFDVATASQKQRNLTAGATPRFYRVRVEQ